MSTFITTTTELWTDHDQMHNWAACLGTEWYIYIYIWLSGESDRHPLGSPAVSVTWIFYLAIDVIQARYACCVNHMETQQHSCRDSRSGCLDIYVLSIYSCNCSLNNSRNTPYGRAMGCRSWVQRLTKVLPWQPLRCVHYRVVYDRDISRVYSKDRS